MNSPPKLLILNLVMTTKEPKGYTKKVASIWKLGSGEKLPDVSKRLYCCDLIFQGLMKLGNTLSKSRKLN